MDVLLYVLSISWGTGIYFILILPCKENVHFIKYFSDFFTKDEAENIIKNGTLNGLFVLGRSVGFIGHFLDQKRLKQGLYRHPWDDISYVLPEMQQ